MISSILWLFEMILSFIERIIRDELFIYKNICKKVLFDDFFFLYIYISYQYAKNLFDDRCLLTFSGMDACFKLKLFQRYNE